jgi:hypothetical protein
VAGAEKGYGYGSLDKNKPGAKSWREPVELVGDLPLTGNEDGDTRLVKGTSEVYQWDATGSAWVLVAGGGGPSPATTVVDETTFGQAPAVGTDVTYSREDHTHGTPTHPGQDKGSFDIVSYVIGPLTEYIYEITLSASNFVQGFLVLYIPVSAPLASRRRQCAFIMFGTAENDAMSKAGGKDTYTFRDYYGIAYTFDNWYHKGFMYAVDTLLSDDQYSVSGANIRIKRCWIDGDKLKITFLNTHGSVNATLTVSGRYHVHR